MYEMSRLMGKPTIYICENKDADQLCGNREADQRLCFRYTDSTIPLLFKSEISSFQPASVTVQPDFCRTCSETTLLVFPRGGSNGSIAWLIIMYFKTGGHVQQIQRQHLKLIYEPPHGKTSNVVCEQKPACTVTEDG